MKLNDILMKKVEFVIRNDDLPALNNLITRHDCDKFIDIYQIKDSVYGVSIIVSYSKYELLLEDIHDVYEVDFDLMHFKTYKNSWALQRKDV